MRVLHTIKELKIFDAGRCILTQIVNLYVLMELKRNPNCIGANAAGVVGGRDPQYLTCRGRPVLTTPQYFDKCFIFFPFSGTSEYRTSLSFSYMHHITPF